GGTPGLSDGCRSLRTTRLSVAADDTAVGLSVHSPSARSRACMSGPTVGAIKSLRANPSRGGDAKPGISRRPPGCRPQQTTIATLRPGLGGPEMPYIIRPRTARSVAVAVLGSALLSCAVPAM